MPIASNQEFNIISVKNSTVAVPSLGVSFVGETENVVRFSSLTISLGSVSSDLHTGLLFFEFSPDGYNWDISVSTPHSSETPFIPRALRIVNKFFRLRYISNDSNLLQFRLQTTLHTWANEDVTRLLSQDININDPIKLTGSILYAQDSSNLSRFIKNTSSRLANHVGLDVSLIDKVIDGYNLTSSNSAMIIAGSDGTNSRFIKVNSDGTIRIDPTGITTQPISDANGSLTVDNNGIFAVQAEQSGVWTVRNQDGLGNSFVGLASSPIGNEVGIITRNIPSGIQEISGLVTVLQGDGWNIATTIDGYLFGASFPVSGQAIGFLDGYGNLESPRLYDTDLASTKENTLGVVLRKSANGGSVELGTNENPIQVLERERDIFIVTDSMPEGNLTLADSVNWSARVTNIRSISVLTTSSDWDLSICQTSAFDTTLPTSRLVAQSASGNTIIDVNLFNYSDSTSLYLIFSAGGADTVKLYVTGTTKEMVQ